jgi:hypothetical protein
MRLVPINDSVPLDENYVRLEQGEILFFPRTPFAVPDTGTSFLRGISQSDTNLHKNVAYRPSQDKVTGFRGGAPADLKRLHAVMRDYSRAALGFLRALLPRYMENCRVDYASFRPYEEEGRQLSMNKRNDLLHVDAFPTRPTGGDLILRMFTNIHESKSRVWMTSEPFAWIAPRYATAAGLERIASPGPVSGLLANLLERRRSPYDRFMLRFHEYLKRSGDYQQSCPKYRLEFPPGSTWMAFTDIVPHAVLSGRYALEQTVIVPRASVHAAERSPLAILEAICRRPLTSAKAAAAERARV